REPGNLNGDRIHTTSGTYNQHILARSQPPGFNQRVPRRHKNERSGGRCFKRNSFREVQQIARRDSSILRIKTRNVLPKYGKAFTTVLLPRLAIAALSTPDSGINRDTVTNGEPCYVR